MGRPINKRFFGAPTEGGNEIKVRFYNGAGTEANGWIVKQLGSKKFRCTDGSDPADCFIVDKSQGTLAEGEMTITVDDDGVARQVTKISGRMVTLDNGSKINWDFTGTGDVVEMEEAGDDTSFTNADDFEPDAP